MIFDRDEMIEKVTNWHYLGKNQAEFMMPIYGLEKVEELYDQDIYMA